MTSANNILSGGNCTIDFWSRYTAYSGTRYTNCDMYITSGVILATGFSRIYIGSNPISYSDWWNTNSWAVDNTYHHYAYVRNGNTVYVFLDGILKSTRNSGTPWSGKLIIGGTSPSGGTYYRYISDLRVTNGICRWTSNFEPPTKPYISII